jgi:outer membrane protein, multidrug efflux system
MGTRALTLGALILSLCGCRVGPDYRRPDLPVPGQFRTAGIPSEGGPALRWWEQFQDPVLTDTIRAALEHNLDLRIATSRLQEYQANYVGAGSPLWPQLALAATDTRQRQGTAPLLETYQWALTLGWELDFWGRIRRLSEASYADYLGQRQARQAVVLTLVSSVATSYIQLREFDFRLDIARRTLEARRESERLAGLRFKVGVISEMELRQAGAELRGTELSVQQLEQAVAQKENELSLLLGRNPGTIQRGAAIDALALPAIPAALPSELLARRPDIQQAEQALVAANARVGAAQASMFPSISLTGNVGGASPQLSSLFSGPNRVWSFVPTLNLPIFSGGSLRAQLRVSQAQRDQAVAGYQRAVQAAFRETEDALIAFTKLNESKVTQARLVEEVRRYAHLARLRYTNGMSSNLEVLDSQRNLFSAEQGLAQTQSAALVATITLIKALGGDWEAEPRGGKRPGQ